jgi:hypothetical protein
LSSKILLEAMMSRFYPSDISREQFSKIKPIDFLRNSLWLEKSMIFLQIFVPSEEDIPKG